MNKLRYDTDTGQFFWNQNVGRWGRIKAGTPAGYIRKDGYVVIRLNGKLEYAHHLVFLMEGGIPEGYEVDHINRNTSDNRRTNLRLVTSCQNKYNTKKPVTNKTGVKGVHWNALTQSYRARIRYDKKHIHIGMFDSLEEAAEAVEKHMRILHGEYFNPTN